MVEASRGLRNRKKFEDSTLQALKMRNRPRAKESKWPLEAEKVRKQILPPQSAEGTQLSQPIFDFCS